MVTLAIQAGGKSSRMGQDKALMPFVGRTLIEWMIAKLSTVAQEIIITTNTPEKYTFLNKPLFSDIYTDVGALGGLHTALHAASHPLVMVVACDMPFANADIFRTGRDRLLQTGADVFIPAAEHGLEPLHAVYRKDSCLSAVEAAILAGERKVISWFPQVKVLELSASETAQYNSHGLAFRNLNTPADFERAKEAVRKMLEQSL